MHVCPVMHAIALVHDALLAMVLCLGHVKSVLCINTVLVLPRVYHVIVFALIVKVRQEQATTVLLGMQSLVITCHVGFVLLALNTIVLKELLVWPVNSHLLVTLVI